MTTAKPGALALFRRSRRDHTSLAEVPECWPPLTVTILAPLMVPMNIGRFGQRTSARWRSRRHGAVAFRPGRDAEGGVRRHGGGRLRARQDPAGACGSAGAGRRDESAAGEQSDQRPRRDVRGQPGADGYRGGGQRGQGLAEPARLRLEGRHDVAIDPDDPLDALGARSHSTCRESRTARTHRRTVATGRPSLWAIRRYPGPSSGGQQRGADHGGGVSAPGQHRPDQQHMGRPARAAAGAAGPQPQRGRAGVADGAGARVPQRRSRPPQPGQLSRPAARSCSARCRTTIPITAVSSRHGTRAWPTSPPSRRGQLVLRRPCSRPAHWPAARSSPHRRHGDIAVRREPDEPVPSSRWRRRRTPRARAAHRHRHWREPVPRSSSSAAANTRARSDRPSSGRRRSRPGSPRGGSRCGTTHHTGRRRPRCASRPRPTGPAHCV